MTQAHPEERTLEYDDDTAIALAHIIQQMNEMTAVQVKDEVTLVMMYNLKQALKKFGAEADEADVDKVGAEGHGEGPGLGIAVARRQLPEPLVPRHLGLRSGSNITNLGRIQHPDLLGNQRRKSSLSIPD